MGYRAEAQPNLAQAYQNGQQQKFEHFVENEFTVSSQLSQNTTMTRAQQLLRWATVWPPQ